MHPCPIHPNELILHRQLTIRLDLHRVNPKHQKLSRMLNLPRPWNMTPNWEDSSEELDNLTWFTQSRSTTPEIDSHVTMIWTLKRETKLSWFIIYRHLTIQLDLHGLTQYYCYLLPVPLCQSDAQGFQTCSPLICVLRCGTHSPGLPPCSGPFPLCAARLFLADLSFSFPQGSMSGL